MNRVAWIVLAASVCLQSCESTNGMRGRLAGGVGTTRLSARDGGETAHFDGLQQSLRAEVVQPLDYIENVEVGLRLKGGFRQIEETIGVVPYELDSSQLALMPTFRGMLPLAGSARLYGEVFGGYEHFWAEERLPGLSNDFNDGGLVYGGGAGVEFGSGAGSALGVGLEWSRMQFEDGSVDLNFDDISLVVAWSFGF